jgi:hypothetical protein
VNGNDKTFAGTKPAATTGLEPNSVNILEDRVYSVTPGAFSAFGCVANPYCEKVSIVPVGFNLIVRSAPDDVPEIHQGLHKKPGWMRFGFRENLFNDVAS